MYEKKSWQEKVGLTVVAIGYVAAAVFGGKAAVHGVASYQASVASDRDSTRASTEENFEYYMDKSDRESARSDSENKAWGKDMVAAIALGGISYCGRELLREQVRRLQYQPAHQVSAAEIPMITGFYPTEVRPEAENGYMGISEFGRFMVPEDYDPVRPGEDVGGY